MCGSTEILRAEYEPTFLQQKALRCPAVPPSSFSSFSSSSPFQTPPWRLADAVVPAPPRLNARSDSRCHRDTNRPRGWTCPGGTGRSPSPSRSPRRFLFFASSSFSSSCDRDQNPPVAPLQLAPRALRCPAPLRSASSSSSSFSSSSCSGETAALRCWGPRPPSGC